VLEPKQAGKLKLCTHNGHKMCHSTTGIRGRSRPQSTDLGTWSYLFSDEWNRRKLYGNSFTYPISETKAQKTTLLWVLEGGINAAAIYISYRDYLYQNNSFMEIVSITIGLKPMQHGYGYAYRYRKDTDTRIRQFSKKTRYADTFYYFFK